MLRFSRELMFILGRATRLLLVVGVAGGAALVGACTGSTQDHARVEVRSSDCIVCHVTDVQHALNPPHEGFPDTCGSCHGNEAWSPAAFMHTWPLNGAHAAIECAACHLGDPPGTGDAHALRRLPPGPTTTTARSPDTPISPSRARTVTRRRAGLPRPAATHPENEFPIQNGDHSKYRDDCVSCHNPDLGSPVDGENTDCVGCHDGEHTRAKMDPKHVRRGRTTRRAPLLRTSASIATPTAGKKTRPRRTSSGLRARRSSRPTTSV